MSSSHFAIWTTYQPLCMLRKLKPSEQSMKLGPEFCPSIFLGRTICEQTAYVRNHSHNNFLCFQTLNFGSFGHSFQRHESFCGTAWVHFQQSHTFFYSKSWGSTTRFSWLKTTTLRVQNHKSKVAQKMRWRKNPLGTWNFLIPKLAFWNRRFDAPQRDTSATTLNFTFSNCERFFRKQKPFFHNKIVVVKSPIWTGIKSPIFDTSPRFPHFLPFPPCDAWMWSWHWRHPCGLL